MSLCNYVLIYVIRTNKMHTFFINDLIQLYFLLGAWGSVVVKALRYWSDGPGIDSRWCHWGFFPWYPRQNHVP